MGMGEDSMTDINIREKVKGKEIKRQRKKILNKTGKCR